MEYAKPTKLPFKLSTTENENKYCTVPHYKAAQKREEVPLPVPKYFVA